MGDYTLSEDGVRFIGKQEGYVPNLYNDPAGHCTIGYGHLVHHGNCNGSEPEEFLNGISEDRGLELLMNDAAVAAGEVNKSVTVSLEQYQFDALMSFTFNVGTGAFRTSTLLKRLNAGEYDAVPSEMNRWVKGGGGTLPVLVNRRKAEGALFQDGTYE